MDLSIANVDEQTHVVEDVISLAPAAALSATLDHESRPAMGDVLPELWHWLYFWPLAGRSLRDPGLTGRMSIGGRLRFHALFEFGETAKRSSQVLDAKSTAGRIGDRALVTLKHEFSGVQGVLIEEEEDLIYREPAQPCEFEPASTRAPVGGMWQRRVELSERLLFRYSSLTFNSHRIHDDKPYATQVERYCDLVAQGPLLATLLIDVVHRNMPYVGVEKFEFRATKPTFPGSTLTLYGQPSKDGRSVELWCADQDGWLAMTAHARLA
ncbi:HTD2 family dehydratase [Paraburkholderia sp. 2C]